MFETHPDTMKYFPQFSGLDSPAEQKKSEVFQEHSEKVNNTWNKALQKYIMVFRFMSVSNNDDLSIFYTWYGVMILLR